MNNLYSNEWRLFHNFFLPSVKLLEKKLAAGKTFKKYDNPMTPYQRILKSPHISDSTKLSLTKQFDSLNPFHLRKTIEDKLKSIFSISYSFKNNYESISPW